MNIIDVEKAQHEKNKPVTNAYVESAGMDKEVIVGRKDREELLTGSDNESRDRPPTRTTEIGIVPLLILKSRNVGKTHNVTQQKNRNEAAALENIFNFSVSVN